MDKCPYCGADTRPEDNFCLNCGNRLTASSAAPAQATMSDDTQASPEEWNAAQDHAVATMPATSDSWSHDGETTLAEPAGELPTQHSAQPAVADRIEQPARFILRSDDGTILKEYPLEKLEIAIGRAPNSDIPLFKDKLTSRRHATVRYENGNYVLRDERSANGTFVNGQQIEEMVPRVLEEGDHVGIGEHELLFRSHNAVATGGVEDMPTIAVSPPPELTYRTRDDAMATTPTNDDFRTHSMDDESSAVVQPQGVHIDTAYHQPEEQHAEAPAAQNVPPYETAGTNGSAQPEAPASASATPVPSSYSPAPIENDQQAISTPAPSVHTSQTASMSMQPTNSSPSTTGADATVTFSRLTSISQPSLPDMTSLLAALAALDGQVMSLQEQINATQDAMHNHDAEIAQTTNQLRSNVRRVAERMDNTIADVARSREALAWADLSQLMEDVMNNPRDIEYVTKLARKARELNKIFQIHQNVLNTMYECNSLLRGLVGDER